MSEQTSAAAEFDKRLYVASVAKAMQIMEAFDLSKRPLSLSDITTLTGLGRSAVQRFVYTLYSLGYLRRDPHSKLYSLSPKVFNFVHGMIGANAAFERNAHVLSQLAKDTQETVSWVELDGDEIVVIGNVPSVHLASITLPVGSRFPALPSSSGQVMLCEQDPPALTEMINGLDPTARRRFGKKTTDEILAYFKAVQCAGYSLTEKSIAEGSISISAPVYDFNGHAIAAINLSTLSSRFTVASALAKLVPKVVTAAQAASS